MVNCAVRAAGIAALISGESGGWNVTNETNGTDASRLINPWSWSQGPPWGHSNPRLPPRKRRELARLAREDPRGSAFPGRTLGTRINKSQRSHKSQHSKNQ